MDQNLFLGTVVPVGSPTENIKWGLPKALSLTAWILFFVTTVLQPIRNYLSTFPEGVFELMALSFLSLHTRKQSLRLKER
jgi:hypothetical protein